MTTAPASSPALSAEHRPERISISRSGSVTLVTQHAPTGQRPFLHPIVAPDGNGTLTENEPPHHPWQHGLYIGLNDVGGVGYWTEGRVNNAMDGSFRPAPLAAPQVSGQRAGWEVACDYLKPDGSTQLHERQRWTLRDHGSLFELDLSWSLTAAVDVAFGQYAYGGLFIRMPFQGQGTVVNSEGKTAITDCEGKRARWVAIAMPIPDRTGGDMIAGIVMMDHPSNPEHPSPWRVDGQLGIAPSRCIAGAWTLAAGATSTSHYRVLVHAGATDVAAVEASWNQFSINSVR